jgi:ATP-dependent Clp protease adaptor protein ClpS
LDGALSSRYDRSTSSFCVIVTVLPMSNDPASPETTVNVAPKEREETSTRRVPPYNVVLENDDTHSFQFVVEVLRKALGYSAERAFQLTLLAHKSGRAVVWTAPKEVAELKAEQVRTFHETRDTDGAKLGPVTCVIEPAPGA